MEREMEVDVDSDQPVASVHIPQCLNADREHSTSTYCLPLEVQTPKGAFELDWAG